jgi:hypothetical protein
MEFVQQNAFLLLTTGVGNAIEAQRASGAAAALRQQGTIDAES